MAAVHRRPRPSPSRWRRWAIADCLHCAQADPCPAWELDKSALFVHRCALWADMYSLGAPNLYISAAFAHLCAENYAYRAFRCIDAGRGPICIDVIRPEAPPGIDMQVMPQFGHSLRQQLAPLFAAKDVHPVNASTAAISLSSPPWPSTSWSSSRFCRPPSCRCAPGRSRSSLP